MDESGDRNGDTEVGGVRSKTISTLPRQAGQDGEEVVSVAIVVGKEGPVEYDEYGPIGIEDDIELSIVRTDGCAGAEACEGGGRRTGRLVGSGGAVNVEGSR
jgi:hypothetical protein